jgi:hypothetical protein
MVKRSKPLGNKREREQAKRRKSQDKEQRRAARKAGGGTPTEPEGDPRPPLPETPPPERL